MTPSLRPDNSRPMSRAGALAIEMTRWPSVTGSDDEAAFSGRLISLLAGLDYFQARPAQLLALDTHGNPPRRNVAALVRGKGRHCLVLAGHYDTVSIDNYGGLAPLACEPEALTQALIEALSGKTRSPAEDRTLEDLLSGAFLAGRGLLDMKSGLAAGIAVLERFAALEEPPGNLLFVATPDEENRSRGMRALRDSLPSLANQFGLDIIGGINLDASGDDGDGTEGRAVYFGSVGKFSPFAFVSGRPTHAGYAFDGVSAHLIGAEIMRTMETNSALCDEAHGEISPAPVCLEARDLRRGYEVTTPAHVWLSFNWLTHKRTPPELLDTFKTLVAGAMQAALDAQACNAAAFFERQGNVKRTEACQAHVLTFAQLHAQALLNGGAAAAERLAAVQQSLADAEDPMAITRQIVTATLAEAGLEGPLVVVGFSTLHYPRVHIGSLGHAGEVFGTTIVSASQRCAEKHATSIRAKQFFAGISDMSFFGHRPEADETELLAANTPCASFIDRAQGEALSFPVVNIGPWGRDYHQKWERVHMDYTFNVLPDVIYEAAFAALNDAG
ncbi:M20/M25/M40 family metallo-hydrolase [Pararhizobium gei]|uniref:M20/M25/M40 family metallo-hydrolase n=1 Tax=Pararhizobium gei TaxID=1395951 RepID=UPI0023DA6DCE|nr:M20/M25/M40 family metallo-hydrolase [Rhizobium gei]